MGATRRVHEKLDSETIEATTSLDRSTGERILRATAYTTPDEDCNFEWDVRFENLIAATPRVLVATYELDEVEYKMEYPGFTRRTVRGEDQPD